MIVIEELLFDEWNIEHIARHKVLPQEIEEVCQNEIHVSRTYSKRYQIIGVTKLGRVLTVIMARKNERRYYPVTARPASRKERKSYLEKIKNYD